MVARAYTVAFEGVEARMVEVQCAVAAGLPAFAVVGLPDKAVSEAKERVRAALAAMSIALPSKRITVNLSPADLPKEGSHFDLPIALALLAALEIIPMDEVERTVALGELSLDGRLMPVIGALPAAMAQLLTPGLAISYLPSNMVDAIPEGARDPLVISNSPIVWTYNTALHESCPVSNIWALTDPEWQGRVVLPDPLGKPAYTDWFNQFATHHEAAFAEAYQAHYGKPAPEGAAEAWVTASPWRHQCSQSMSVIHSANAAAATHD